MDILEMWGRQLKCPPDRFEIAATILNGDGNTNLLTPMALIFDVNATAKLAWLNQVKEYFREAVSSWPPGTKTNATWLKAFVDHYLTEVSKP
jgi:hypothetical protein